MNCNCKCPITVKVPNLRSSNTSSYKIYTKKQEAQDPYQVIFEDVPTTRHIIYKYIFIYSNIFQIMLGQINHIDTGFTSLIN